MAKFCQGLKEIKLIVGKDYVEKVLPYQFDFNKIVIELWKVFCFNLFAFLISHSPRFENQISRGIWVLTLKFKGFEPMAYRFYFSDKLLNQ